MQDNPTARMRLMETSSHNEHSIRVETAILYFHDSENIILYNTIILVVDYGTAYTEYPHTMCTHLLTVITYKNSECIMIICTIDGLDSHYCAPCTEEHHVPTH